MKPISFLIKILIMSSVMSHISAAIAGCTHATPQQIANALQNAPNLKPQLKSCAMAAMAMGESSGGNTCASNSCCVGILQLNVGPKGLNYTPTKRSQYQTSSLQNQINIWVETANSNANSKGYTTLNAAYTSGQTIHGTKVTPGMLAACEQFGSGECNHNVAALKASGNCGTYTDGKTHRGGQTICSWGHHADVQAANQKCSLGTCKSGSALPAPNNPITTPNNSVGTPEAPVTTPTPTTNFGVSQTPLIS